MTKTDRLIRDDITESRTADPKVASRTRNVQIYLISTTMLSQTPPQTHTVNCNWPHPRHNIANCYSTADPNKQHSKLYPVHSDNAKPRLSQRLHTQQPRSPKKPPLTHTSATPIAPPTTILANRPPLLSHEA